MKKRKVTKENHGNTMEKQFFCIQFLFGKQIITYMAVKGNEYLIYCDFKIIPDCGGCYVFDVITLY